MMEECKQGLFAGLFAQTIYQNNKTEYSKLLDTDIQNVLVQERSAGGHYDIGILSLFKEEWAVQNVASTHIAAHPEYARFMHVLCTFYVI